MEPLQTYNTRPEPRTIIEPRDRRHTSQSMTNRPQVDSGRLGQRFTGRPNGMTRDDRSKQEDRMQIKGAGTGRDDQFGGTTDWTGSNVTRREQHKSAQTGHRTGIVSVLGQPACAQSRWFQVIQHSGGRILKYGSGATRRGQS